uniref:Uncharacterized protein n=1 Tax=Percolomonas cosmopolitus TaxID=63605 RepID=A0A7S1KRZ7_9EUKA|mmetsp:Transcript_6971/g.26066  ORF Transcript_6971/g.26066 Transcript_6971/m.26066 type:complete len:423 (+) Transcript_6971:1905-3173(+)
MELVPHTSHASFHSTTPHPNTPLPSFSLSFPPSLSTIMPPSTPPSPPQTSSAASSSTPTPSQSSPFYHKYNSLVQKIVKMSPKGKIVDPRQAAKNDVLGSIGKDTATAHGNSSGEEDLRLRRDLASSTTNHDQARFQQTERAVELSQQDKTPTMEYQNNDRLRHLLRRNVWRDDESAMRGVASVQRGNASSFPQQQGANGLGGGRPLIFAGTPPSPHHFRPSNESSSPSTSTHRPGLTSPSDKVPLLLSSMTPVHILEALLGEFESDDENFNSEDDNMDLTPPPETESLAAQPSRRSSFSSSFSSINNASPAANRRSKSPSTTRRRRSSSAKRRRKVTSKTGKPKSRAYYMTKHLTSSLNMHAFFQICPLTAKILFRCNGIAPRIRRATRRRAQETSRQQKGADQNGATSDTTAACGAQHEG